MRQAELGALDLALVRLAAQVRRDLVDVRNAGCSERVALGEQSARHVDRNATTQGRFVGVDRAAGHAGVDQPEVLVVENLGTGEAVVERDHG